jgi:demethylmenaquinone methyltransferase/2-methoxy-6-polyprenyl-1,4-benzoquinol methylase
VTTGAGNKSTSVTLASIGTRSDAGRDQLLRQGYDREAAQYDAHRYVSAEGRYFSNLELRLLKAWLPLGPGKKLLDMPAGTGRLSVALGQTGATIIGTDISLNMLIEADNKGRRAAAVNAHFVQGSGVQLPFEDDTFDAVVSFKFFHLVPNDRKPEFVRELTRVLKPGGALVFEFNSPFYGGILAAFRYYFRKKRPGGMRTKCLFPDQVTPLFSGLEITRRCGVKFPGAGTMASIIGVKATEALDLWFGRLPGVRYLSYAIIFEARKPSSALVNGAAD